MQAGRSGTTIIALVLALAVLSEDLGAAQAASSARGGLTASSLGPPPAPVPMGRLVAAVRARADSCNPNTDTLSPHDAARYLMAGRYKVGHHPLVTLGRRPTWAEDPLRDHNWRERLQMLGS